MEESRGFKLHEASEAHIEAFKKLWFAGMCGVVVSSQNGGNLETGHLDNRHYIKTVTQVVVLLQRLGYGSARSS